MALMRTLEPWLEGRGGGLAGTEWGRGLLELAEKVRVLADEPSYGLHPPRGLRIPKPGGEFRTLHVYDRLEERVFLKLLWRYLRDQLDPLFGEEVLAFRKHQWDPRGHAVRRIRAFPHPHPFVGEADIQACYDNLPHREIRRALHDAANELPRPLHPNAMEWVERYLSSHAANGTPGHRDARGIPQGGALSPLLCNLTLRVADRAVLAAVPRDLLYMRFCDDIVLLHPTESGCLRALDAYGEAMDRLGLTLHPEEHAGGDAAAFAAAKSKAPYRWYVPIPGVNTHPCVSFLGYDIHVGGHVSVRAKSIESHRRKLDDELFFLLRLFRKERAIHLRPWTNADGRFRAVTGYLLHRAIGRACPGRDPAGQLHWASAFSAVTPHHQTLGQLRRLDRDMARRLWLLDSSLRPYGHLGRFPSNGHVGAAFSYYERFLRPGMPRPRIWGSHRNDPAVIELLSLHFPYEPT